MHYDKQDTLKQALQAVSSHIDDLDVFIALAVAECHFPSEHGLTKDESAAIYLYTMEWRGQQIYQRIESDLRNRPEVNFHRWIHYLELLDSALMKLPSSRKTIWFHKENIPWWFPFPCKSNVSVTTDEMFRIEAVYARLIADYSSRPEKDQWILRMGTRIEKISDPSWKLSYYHEIVDGHDGKIRRIQSYGSESLYLGNWDHEIYNYGKTLYFNGAAYEGEGKHKTRDGYGRLTLSTGEEYEWYHSCIVCSIH